MKSINNTVLEKRQESNIFTSIEGSSNKTNENIAKWEIQAERQGESRQSWRHAGQMWKEQYGLAILGKGTAT